MIDHILDNADKYGLALLVTLGATERLLMALFKLLELADAAAARTQTKRDDAIVATIRRGMRHVQTVVGLANKWIQPLVGRKPKTPGK